MKAIALLVALASSAACITGPTCVARQRRGTIEPLTGRVEAGETVMHLVPYATEGSQNTLDISWSDARIPNGPRLNVYVTRASCDALNVAATFADGDCAVLGRGGSSNGVIVNSVTVTHGRGNPEILGSPPAYKVWIVGDAVGAVTYTIAISWFFGPDC
jgi:hypothetical protein